MLVRSLLTDFQGLIASQIALAVFELILFSFSVFLVVLPVSNALKEDSMTRVELMLKAPIKPGDVLIGEFIGRSHLYTIFAIIAIGFFTALLTPLGLSPLQIALIIFMAFATCISMFWIGTVIASISRTTIGKTAKGKDIGKALSFIIILPLVAIMYAMISGNLFTLLMDPGTDGLVKMVLGLFPSSWAAEVIVAFAQNPSNISAVLRLTMTRLGGMIVFIIATIAIGWKVTNKAYSLEPTNIGVTVVGPDRTFYRVIKMLGGGGTFGSLLASVFKDYSRRMENLSQIGYIVGLLIIMNYTFVDDASGVQMMGLLMSTVMALFISSESTIRGKEALFIYRKTPKGVANFMMAKLLQGWVIVIPVMAVIWMYSGLRFNIAFTTSFILDMSYALLVAMANTMISLGLSFANPAYNQKSPAYIINFQVIGFLVLGCLIVPDMVLHMPRLHMPLAWVIGIVLLYLGHRKLTTME
jgi:hypothetical protein